MASAGSVALLWVTWLCHVATSCPPGCHCGHDLASPTWVVCHGRSRMPPAVAESVHTLNMTGNSVAVVTGNAGKTLRVLDLSYNRIATVEEGSLGDQSMPNLVSLNLTSNYLTRIPTLSSSLQSLVINANRIGTINMSDLCHLSNLNTLHLDNNKITKIVNLGSRKCQGLLELRILSLQNNLMETVDRMLCASLVRLQYLNLAHNRISTIKFDSFKGLKMLRYLDLSGNKIQTIAPKTFKHFYDLKFLSLSQNLLKAVPEELSMVEWLDLSSNHITTISERQQRSFYPQEVFLIGRNPLHCSCELLWLKELYDSREYQLKYIDVDSEKFIPTCSTPSHLHGDTWDVLANAAFGCSEPRFDSASTNEEEDDIPIWKLKDLSVTVVEVGETFFKVEWDSQNQKVVSDEKHVLMFNIHPFGKKNLHKSISVHPRVGRYMLKALRPNTAYIVCMDIFSEKSGPSVFTLDNCLEIVTREAPSPENALWNAILQSPTIYLVLLTLSICVVFLKLR